MRLTAASEPVPSNGAALARGGVGQTPAGDCLCVVAACGALGRLDEARAALTEMFRLRPNMVAGQTHARPRMMDPIFDSLRKAGLDIPEEPSVDD